MIRTIIMCCVGIIFFNALNAQTNDSLSHKVVEDSVIADTLRHPIDSLQTADTLSALDNVVTNTSSDHTKKSYVAVGLSYMNDNVYLGRKDSMALPYLTFDLGYYHKSGLYVDGSINYLASSSQNRIDAINFTGGYSFTSKKYSGDASVSKYFYSSQSTNVKSEVTGSLSYFNSYDFGFVATTLNAFLDFGKKTDIGGAFGIERTFYALDDNLDFTPTVTLNASSQNFYNNYYKTRRYTIKRKNGTPVTGIAKISGIVQNASAFKILDYEISLPVDYQLGKFTLGATPVYAFPVNPAVVAVTTTRANNVSNTKFVTEKVENTFFITLSVRYKFGN